MSPVASVISDFGGVLTTPLLDGFLAFEQSTGISLEDLGAAMAALTERDGENPLFRLETGRVTEADFLTSLSGELTRIAGEPVELPSFGERLFDHLHPNEPMIEYMRSLRGRGLGLAICTNNVREWETRWRSMLPVDEIFDAVVDSGFVGIRKPDPEIYRITLQQLGAQAESTIFIDDIEINCDAARELGMIAVHFRTSEQAIAEIEAALAGTD